MPPRLRQKNKRRPLERKQRKKRVTRSWERSSIIDNKQRRVISTLGWKHKSSWKRKEKAGQRVQKWLPKLFRNEVNQSWCWSWWSISDFSSDSFLWEYDEIAEETKSLERWLCWNHCLERVNAYQIWQRAKSNSL